MRLIRMHLAIFKLANFTLTRVQDIKTSFLHAMYSVTTKMDNRRQQLPSLQEQRQQLCQKK